MKKIVLITGASSGLGLSTTKYFAQKGNSVIIHYYRHEKEAKALEKEIIEKYQVRALSIKANLQNELEIKRMIETVEKQFGRIDILINNAGIAIDTVCMDKTKDNFIKTLDINLIAPFLVSKYVTCTKY